jgi:hypothetical protein
MRSNIKNFLLSSNSIGKIFGSREPPPTLPHIINSFLKYEINEENINLPKTPVDRVFIPLFLKYLQGVGVETEPGQEYQRIIEDCSFFPSYKKEEILKKRKFFLHVGPTNSGKT